MFTQSAFDIWRQEQNTPRIITLCSELDKQLGGGIECGRITEFCGGPATGKTQICLQLCLTAQIPSATDNDNNGKAIIIDTNQDFSPLRLQELAELISGRYQRIFRNVNSSAKASFTTENLLKNITYINCTNSQQLMANLILLENRLSVESTIKLIVIDSFAAIIRNIDDGVAERTRTLYILLTELHQLAKNYKIAIVLTNELTTHLINRSKLWIIRPALGHIHAHKINQRILLSHSNEADVKNAFIEKSNVTKKSDVIIKIRKDI